MDVRGVENVRGSQDQQRPRSSTHLLDQLIVILICIVLTPLVFIAGYDWARTPVRQPSSPHSAVYPDRPIRPLPKRPLRSRLSPEQAGSIVYPPAPPATGPLFSFPYSQSPPFSAGPHRGEGEHPYQHAHPADVHMLVEEEDIDDESWVDGQRYNTMTGRIDRASVDEMNGSAHPPPPPGSTTSSADGYESFENTNNKKKRKIPVSAAAGAHGSAVLSEAPGVAVPSSRGHASQFDDPSSGTGQYYGSGTSAMAASASGTGISGAGRGRYGRNGRVPSERRPLGLSTSGANVRANPGGGLRKEWGAGASVDEKEQGIISAAIASAAEYGQNNNKTNGNVSLLQQEATKPGPKNSQFTFTCESESSNNVVWPEPYSAEDHRKIAARQQHPDQRMPPLPSGKGSYGSPMPPNSTPNPNQAPPATQPKPPRPKRPAAAYYAKAERERRRKQEAQNIHHPPGPSDLWICEFCEYEAIFGTRPEALIRSYEIKDRAEQKRMEEKRRLLEKARMRGRRGKKGKKTKGGNTATNAVTDANPGKHGHPHHDDGMELQGSGSGSSTHAVAGPEHDYEDEFFEDEYDGGEYDDAMPALLPSTPSNPTRNAWNDGHGQDHIGARGAGPPHIPSSL